jgi:hypothetical protein
MKKCLSVFLCLAVLIVVGGGITAFAGDGELSLLVNNEPVLLDQSPVVEDGIVLVPLRGVFESLGATVSWDDETKTVFISYGENSVLLQINNNHIFKNSETIALDIPAKIINDRTMITLNTVEIALNVSTNWDAQSNTVHIISED